MTEWTPLNDIWKDYGDVLEEAVASGQLDDPEEAQDVVFPQFLYIGEQEKEDIQEFINYRLQELVSNFQDKGKVNTDLIGTYIFRAIISGMQWEKERRG